MIDSWDLSPALVGWAIVGVAVFLLVGYVLVSFVGAIVLGIFLYYATRPVYRWLTARFDRPRLNATATLLTVGLPLLAILAYAVLVGVRELDLLFAQTGLEELRSLLDPYVDVARLTDPRTLVDRVGGRVPEFVGVTSAALTWVLRVFVAVTVAYYLLQEDRNVASWTEQSFHEEYGVVSFLRGVDDDLTTIYTGNLLTIGATGLIAVGVYVLLDVVSPQSIVVAAPILLGLLTGVATLIPAVGMKLVYVPYVGYLFYQAATKPAAPLWFPVVFLVITILVIDSFPDIVIRSYISKGEINMGLIMLSYVLGAVTFGWYGVFLAPIVLVVFLHFAHRVLPNLLDPAETRLVSESWSG
jgi:predicted PurR-regulated permease PerM